MDMGKAREEVGGYAAARSAAGSFVPRSLSIFTDVLRIPWMVE
jgi:hypothetical protein